ncbi:MAG: hypothetical protein PVG39_11330 [Desulfobacteraceae bacterium]|jgi:transposase
MSTNKQRRAVYKFYRDIGYSPARAAKMRNRTKQVITDWGREKRSRRQEMIDKGNMRPRPLKAPVEVLDRKDILKLRKDLVDMGISKRAAYNMTRSKQKALYNKYSIERLIEEMGKPTRKGAKKAYKKMMKRWNDAQSTADIYNAIETNYTALIGVK